jgi:N utilization substance protein B
VGSRRKAREITLQILYQYEAETINPDQEFQKFFHNYEGNPEVFGTSQNIPEEVKAFVLTLLKGVVEKKEKIDEILQTTSKNWSLDRMARVDRNIMRIAIYELLFCNDIPVRVTINEAIEIGKKFGTSDSGAFINGILDKVSLLKSTLEDDRN